MSRPAFIVKSGASDGSSGSGDPVVAPYSSDMPTLPSLEHTAFSRLESLATMTGVQTAERGTLIPARSISAGRIESARPGFPVKAEAQVRPGDQVHGRPILPEEMIRLATDLFRVEAR